MRLRCRRSTHRPLSYILLRVKLLRHYSSRPTQHQNAQALYEVPLQYHEVYNSWRHLQCNRKLQLHFRQQEVLHLNLSR